jgi:MYXO-CTERM domain-containing protein
VPAAGKCLEDGITLETGPGETKSCAPYRCQGGECASPCVTSSQCTSVFACDHGECVQLADDASTEEGGCGCRAAGSAPTRGALALWLVGIALLARRRRA